jgi:hypothetical protein
MRPLYETQHDRNLEQTVMDLFCEYKGYSENKKLDISERLDFNFSHNGELAGFAEVKVRNNTREKYPTYMISLTKLQSAWQLYKQYRKPCYLIVGWTDCIGMIDFFSHPYVDVGGRKDRGDIADIELVCHYDISRFVLFDHEVIRHDVSIV